VDAIGFIFAPSERQISISRAAAIVPRLAPFGALFGVFVDPDPTEVRQAQAAIPGMHVQFSGNESAEFCESLAVLTYFKALHLGGPRDDAAVIAQAAEYVRGIPIFDSWHPEKRGGTGVTLAWSRLEQAARPAFFAVSGGLTAENVGQCVRLLKPNVVDVRSGVETDGRKDEQKLRAFVRAVREADAQA
jgi:phosphoribosylanthranilate isomerase